MGEPVRIVDLAENMIRLAGYEPETDIAIEFTGPRPGEQLHERLLAEGEHSEPTAAPRITRAVRAEPILAEEVETMIERLNALLGAGDETNLGSKVVEIISGSAAAALHLEGSRRADLNRLRD